MMRKEIIFLHIIVLVLSVSCGTNRGPVRQQSIIVEAPFVMPVIVFPDFSDCPVFPITDFGAVQGDKQKISEAIARAIEEASLAGGGSVVIPRGEWLTGKIHLMSNVNLHLEKGAVLLFSDDPDDYLPPVLLPGRAWNATITHR